MGSRDLRATPTVRPQPDTATAGPGEGLGDHEVDVGISGLSQPPVLAWDEATIAEQVTDQQGGQRGQ